MRCTSSNQSKPLGMPQIQANAGITRIPNTTKSKMYAHTLLTTAFIDFI